MRKVLAALILVVLPSMAVAHQDRILPIESDGTLGDLPDRYGPVKVHFERPAGAQGGLRSVVLSSPKFRVSLNQCVLQRLSDVSHVQASGSWYHTRGTLPPYVTLTFYSGRYDKRSATNQYYSVTYSLLDGRILMGQRAWDPPLGDWRGQVIDPADKCSHWRRLGMRPNNSFKPKPLRGSA